MAGRGSTIGAGLAVALVTSSLGAAAADEDGGAPPRASLPAGPVAGAIPDASFFAMLDREVEVETSDGARYAGRLVRVDVHTITVVADKTRDVVTLHRAVITRLRAAEAPPPAAPAPAAPPPSAPANASAVPLEPEVERNVGLSFNVAPGVSADVETGRFYGFASWDILALIVGADKNVVLSGALGAGLTLQAFPGSRWRFDLFGMVSPLVIPKEGSYVGIGAGIGLHYTFSSGFTVGAKIPAFGLAWSNKDYKLGESFALFYGTGMAGLPVLSVGYRF